jgi:hypothetical protein
MWHDMFIEQIPLAEKVIQHNTCRQPPVGTQPGVSLSGSTSSTFNGITVRRELLLSEHSGGQPTSSRTGWVINTLTPHGAGTGTQRAARFNVLNTSSQCWAPGRCPQRRPGLRR